MYICRCNANNTLQIVTWCSQLGAYPHRAMHHINGVTTHSTSARSSWYLWFVRREKSGQSVNLSSHIRLLPNTRMSEAIPPLPFRVI